MLFIGALLFTAIYPGRRHNGSAGLYFTCVNPHFTCVNPPLWGRRSALYGKRGLKHWSFAPKLVPCTDRSHQEPEEPLIDEIIQQIVRVAFDEVRQRESHHYDRASLVKAIPGLQFPE